MGFMGMLPILLGLSFVVIGIIFTIMCFFCVLVGIGNVLLFLGKKNNNKVKQILGYICYGITAVFYLYFFIKGITTNNLSSIFFGTLIFLLPLFVCLLIADGVICILDKNFKNHKKSILNKAMILVIDFIIFCGGIVFSIISGN